MISIVYTGLLALLGWGVVLGILFYVKDMPRIWFIILHYLVDIVVFGGIFWVYAKFGQKVEPFQTMAIAMIALIAAEFVLWKFVAPGNTQYLTFVDWIVPAFLIASTVYFVTLVAR